MIDLYTWTTPNGRKVSIMLEEAGLAYEVHPVDIGKEEQFAPSFLKISPNNRIPAIIDRDTDGGPVSIFESGAILIYLAEKTGKFLAPKGEQRAKTLEWLMWQMGGVGPMLGQANHFINTAPEKIPYAIDRYITEAARLIKVLDTRLGKADYMGGDYSIADMATYPWLAVAFDLILQAKPDVIGEGTNVKRWLAAVGKRPAVERGMAVPKV
ncbi:glutathione S-transferase N-terminal domain-containing protein [Parvibaculum sp.]|jgi:GST-like protein|uniref:glutathione S-transferase N-terminal domain-containing protein n=1 Tax=Parvibaculum sp. TaxID=2024848 RepID=UPI001B111A79|nr:glutathione S-transferase N-terminal domain-containing protein [Parvibaculum sp.]MBO6636185.1 glutathione S-transferase N-terminal domain-containing protein [Parvibaculum sp.]MBO6680174.1 glutathione S-transferase N-terminal domain-containing protein [Parvibaculum sp.]MBO6683835.1 glutathione S-transferase N-terminal domain-containing protein [Parvibaculum sp.]MBO6903523.1 glutathione S-transferase N-terminal domain-containing protein [Parvibaculum sp.]